MHHIRLILALAVVSVMVVAGCEQGSLTVPTSFGSTPTVLKSTATQETPTTGEDPPREEVPPSTDFPGDPLFPLGWTAFVERSETKNEIRFTIRVEKAGDDGGHFRSAAFHDPKAGNSPTAKTPLGEFRLTGDIDIIAGGSGVVYATYDLSARSCGRVQLDVAVVDHIRGESAGAETYDVAAEVYNYGKDCSSPTPTPKPTPEPEPEPTPEPEPEPDPCVGVSGEVIVTSVGMTDTTQTFSVVSYTKVGPGVIRIPGQPDVSIDGDHSPYTINVKRPAPGESDRTINGALGLSNNGKACGEALFSFVVTAQEMPDPCVAVSGDVSIDRIDQTELTSTFRITANPIGGVGVVSIDGVLQETFTGEKSWDLVFDRPGYLENQTYIQGKFQVAGQGDVCHRQGFSFVVKPQEPPPCPTKPGWVYWEDVEPQKPTYTIRAGIPDGYAVIDLPDYLGLGEKGFSGANGGETWWEVNIPRPDSGQHQVDVRVRTYRSEDEYRLRWEPCYTDIKPIIVNAPESR